jgi:hypothetical protein
VCTAVLNGWNGSPQLDNFYPYPVLPGAPTTTNDTPGYGLGGVGEGEAERSFGAIMYLLWDPALPTGCSPASTIANGDGTITSQASNCTQSIPIPLGSVAWNIAGCAINTLSVDSGDNGTTWHLACGIPSQNSPENPVFMPSTASVSSYPTWSLTAQNGPVCVTHVCSRQQ